MENDGLRVVLGLDGGGTSTRCVALDPSTREVLGRGSAGSSNKNSVGLPEALEQLRRAVAAALFAAGRGAHNVAAVCAGISGADTPKDVEEYERGVATWLPDKTRVWVCNDAVAALCAGTGGVLHGCVVIAGTGTIAYGVHRSGGVARAAGWGGAFLDGGSGYDIAQRGLAAAARAADGRGPPTALLESLCTACGVPPEDPMQLLGWVYRDPSWGRVASLASVVCDCAQQGDAPASAVLEAAAVELAGSVAAVCRRLGFGAAAGAEQGQSSDSAEPFPVVLAGGLLREGSLLAGRLRAQIEQQVPAAEVRHLQGASPEEGAALLAAQRLQQEQQQAAALAAAAGAG